MKDEDIFKIEKDIKDKLIYKIQKECTHDNCVYLINDILSCERCGLLLQANKQ